MRLLTGVFVITAGLVTAAAQQPAESKVELINAKGEPVGTATLSAARSGGVSIALNLKNLTPGRHAIHFHETPKCEAPTFESAGAHYNPESKKHGLFSPDGPHAGDVNNFTVRKDGTVKASLIAARMAMDTPSALVIHDKADDLKTDPAGNSGDRIACGVVRTSIPTQ